MTKVELRLGGLISLAGGGQIALGQTFALLDGIASERSVRGAAERMGVSYRAAWGQIETLEAAVGGRPLVLKTKGHGSALTEAGAALREMLGAVLREFETPLAEAGRLLEGRLAALLAVDPPARQLRLALSHDPLLLEVVGSPAGEGVADPAVVGSGEALARLRAGLADLAGFHGADGSPDPGDPAWAVRPLFRREQGLILARGNPLGIASLADVAARRARFVNRQRGSGTRAWLDRLLAEAGLQPGNIVGYGVEEFTHQAVAAVVASGAADAGFGLRAVAERFGLTFVPAGWETYCLAGPAGVFDEEPVSRLLAALDDRLADAPGYARP